MLMQVIEIILGVFALVAFLSLIEVIPSLFGGFFKMLAGKEKFSTVLKTLFVSLALIAVLYGYMQFDMSINPPQQHTLGELATELSGKVSNTMPIYLAFSMCMMAFMALIMLNKRVKQDI